MGDWKKYILEELADVQTGPFGSQLHASDYVDIGVPSIMPKDIGQRLNVNLDSISYIMEKDAQRLQRHRVKPNDIVFSRRGDVEKCAFITEEMNGWLCGTGCLKVDFYSQEVVPKFMAYFFSSPESKHWLTNNAVGTTMPNLNSSILGRFPVFLPPFSEQCAIAAVLSALDDKIDLLNRQNKTLEALGQTLFRQWFVEEAEEGWNNCSLYDAIEIVGGGTPSTSITEYWDGEINWLSGKDIANNHKNFVVMSEKKITESGLNNSATKLLPKYSTVISARGTVGKYCILAEPMAFSQTSYGIKPKISGCFFFTYLLIDYSVTELLSAAYGSVFDTITTRTFQEHRVSLPPAREIIAFEEKISPFFYRMHLNQHQIGTLEKLRDTLLPKLMSGEVRVKV